MAVPSFGRARRWAAELQHFWFHALKPSDWFGSSESVDAELGRRFEAELLALSGQPSRSFLTDPALASAAILLFDQVPRNLFRGDARAFAFDPLARAITIGMLARGWHLELTGIGHGIRADDARRFIAMPLMHSESIADQRACLAFFARFLPGDLSFARDHHRMIARFGRFPHRNAVLGRRSSDAELRAIERGFAW